MSDVIPASDVVEVDGRLVVIVDGELTPTCDIVTTADDPEWCHRHQRTGGECLRPPAWVTEAMEPCDRCMDSGWVADHSAGCDRQCGGKCGGLGIKRCDCIDGRRVIEIRTECGRLPGQRPDESRNEFIERLGHFYDAWADKLAAGEYPSMCDDDPESMTGWKHDRHVLIHVRNFAAILRDIAKPVTVSHRVVVTDVQQRDDGRFAVFCDKVPT